MKLFLGFAGFMGRPTHDRLVALRQTGWFPREGKIGRREDLARLSFLSKKPAATIPTRCGKTCSDLSREIIESPD
jgi:hypothetical protein